MKVFHLEEHVKTIMGIEKVSRAQLNTNCMNRGTAVTAGAFPETIFSSQVISNVSSCWTTPAIWHRESRVIKPEMPGDSPDFPIPLLWGWRREKSGKNRSTRRKQFAGSKCFSSQSFSSWSKYVSTLRAVQVRLSAVLCCFCTHVKPWQNCTKED